MISRQRKMIENIYKQIEHPAWRYYKKCLSNSAWQQLSHSGNKANLKDFLEYYSKAYVSVGYFLNAHRIQGKIKKNSYKYADSLFLWSDLLFDIDVEDLKDLEIARQDGIKILDFMKNERNFKLKKIQFSGSHGFHIVYKEKKHIKEQNPLKRIKLYENNREELIEKIKKIGLKTFNENHYRMIKDQYRVYALEGTHKEYLVKRIREKEFRTKTAKELLKSKIVLHSLVRRNPMKEAVQNSVSTPKTSGQERPRLISCSYNFVNNMVNGLRNTYITVLRHHKSKFSKRLLKTVQKAYNLSDFYYFKDENFIISLNFKLVQKERLTKILKKAKSQNLNSWLKYNYSWIRINACGGKEVKEAPRLIGILKSPFGLGDFHSKPHCNLLGIKYRNMAGKEENKIMTCFVKT